MYYDSVAAKAQSTRQLQLALLGTSLLTLLLWRFVGGAWIIIPSLLTVLFAGAVRCHKNNMETDMFTGPLVLLGLALLSAPLIALPVLWPCPLACQGLNEYAQFGSLPTWAWAMLAYGLCLLAGFLAKGEGPNARVWKRLFHLGLAACAGASLWFIMLSWELRVVCNHCLALHTLILIAAVLSSPLSRGTLGALILAVFVSNAAFRLPTVLAPIDALTTHNDHTKDLQRQVELLANKMVLGQAEAPFSADLILDPLCPHCRSTWHNVARKLGPAVGAGTLKIRLRIRYNPRLESSRFAAEMLVASGATGQLSSALPQLISLRQNDSEDGLRTRWVSNGFFQPDAADTILDLIPTAINRLLQQDMAWMEEQQLLRLTTPIMILRSDDNQRQLFWEELPLEDIRQRLNAIK